MTNRKISNVEINFKCINDEDMQTVISIITNFSADIKYFKLRGSTISMVHFLDILSLVSNATSLHFKSLRIDVASSAKAQRLMSVLKDLNFQCLKKLEIDGCDEKVEMVLNTLKAEVLTELRLFNADLRRLKDLFNRAKNVKKLALLRCTANGELVTTILDNLDLESLEYDMILSMKAATALSRQRKLKYLKLGLIYESEEHLMKIVANQLTELEHLDWTVFYTPVEDFVNIRELKNLKHLALSLAYRFDIYDAFKKLDNSRIVTLQINVYTKSKELATSVPKLKVLKVLGPTDWEDTRAIFKHFNFVEGLHVFVWFMDEFDDNYLNQSDSVNPKLNELSIEIGGHPCKASLLNKLITDYPNLEKLVIKAESLTSSQFRQIVCGFTNLKSLKWSKATVLTIDDFTYLRQNNKNLKNLSVALMCPNFLTQHMEVLKVMFEEAKIDRSNYLNIKI